MQANYSLIKAGFIAKALTLTQYFKQSWQVTDNDADANRGADYFIILAPGSLPVSSVPNLNTKKLYRVEWNIVFDMQLRYKSYKESWNNFALMRDDIFNLFVFTIDKSLPGVNGIWDITITAPEPPGQKPAEGAAAWIGQQMTAVITQDLDVTR